MSRHRALQTCVIVVTLSLLSPVAGAAPPPTAESLHKKAVAAYRAGKSARALALWTDAEALAPDWRFAFNIAVIHADDERWLPAWGALERAESLGVPEDKRPLASSVRDEVEAGLARDHAFLELTVSPRDALVERDGAAWDAPRRAWLRTTSSRIRVSAPDHEPLDLDVPHPIGQRIRVPVALVKTLVMGRAIIESEPPGATVFLHGRQSASSPVTLDLRAGEHEVVVVFPSGERQRSAVTVRGGEVHRLRFNALQLAVPTEPSLLPARSRAAEWSLFGSGLALSALGGGLLGWSTSIAGDIDELNAAPPAGYEDYRSRYEELSDRQDATWASGWALVGLGASALVTSACLWWLLEDAPETAAPEP